MEKLHVFGGPVATSVRPSKGWMDPLVAVEDVSRQTLQDLTVRAVVVTGFLVVVEVLCLSVVLLVVVFTFGFVVDQDVVDLVVLVVLRVVNLGVVDVTVWASHKHIKSRFL